MFVPDPTESLAQMCRYLCQEGLRWGQGHKESSAGAQEEDWESSWFETPTSPCPGAPGGLHWMAEQIHGDVCWLKKSQNPQILLLLAKTPVCRLCLNWEHFPAVGNQLQPAGNVHVRPSLCCCEGNNSKMNTIMYTYF